MLGYLYETGKGITKNESQAVKWYEESAKLHYPKAQYNLAVMYLYGRGVEKDKSKAKFWFEKTQKNPETSDRLYRNCMFYLEDHFKEEKEEE